MEKNVNYQQASGYWSGGICWSALALIREGAFNNGR